jgi:hypothetical protein
MTETQELEKKLAKTTKTTLWLFIALMVLLAGEIGYLTYVCWVLVKH